MKCLNTEEPKIKYADFELPTARVHKCFKIW